MFLCLVSTVEKVEDPVYTTDLVKQGVICTKEASEVPDQQQREQKSTRKRPAKRQRKKGAASTATSNKLVPIKRLTLLQKVQSLFCYLLFCNNHN